MKNRPISVLLFSNATARAGAEEHILTLLQGLDRKVFRLSLVCPEVLAEKLLPDLPEDVELVPLYLDKLTQVVAALRLAQVLGAAKWTSCIRTCSGPVSLPRRSAGCAGFQ